jgi:hypothetical protein
VPGWAYALGALALAAAVGVATFLVRTSGTDHAGGAGAAAFGHVHGMAVDPASRALLAATHTGLYRVDGPHTAVRVSEGTQDLMGFTVVGPGHYIASGHPGEHDDGPGNLGLIESADGGKTWKNLSLAGAADFHGLRAAHGSVYGHNSANGAFLVSTDQRTWQRRSTAAIGAFVVSPTDPATIVAVARGGLQRSTDTAATWQPIPASPQLTVLSWDTGDELFGVDATATVWQSADAAATWQQRGRLPAVATALTVSDGALYAAVVGDQLLSSSDRGATWTERYRPA